MSCCALMVSYPKATPIINDWGRLFGWVAGGGWCCLSANALCRAGARNARMGRIAASLGGL